MANILQQLRLWVEQVISGFGYVGIAFLMLLENIFPPIPSEIIMPFAGSLVAQGEMNGIAVFVAGITGTLAGAIIIYALGLWVSEVRARRWFLKYGRFLMITETDYDKAASAFDRHGRKMVLLGRLLPTIRSLISLPAGLNRMNWPAFLLLTTLGTAFWNGLLLSAGLILGENWPTILRFVDAYEILFWIIIGILFAVYLFSRLREGQESRHSENQRNHK